MTVTISGTTGLAGVDGSAGTPAVQGGDTNTGVFFPAADTVAIATGGTEAMRVNSSQNVGIGTTAPTARLTVVTGAAGNNEGEIRISENATYYAGLRRVNATDEFRIGSYGASQNLTFYTVSSERARIDSSGNLLVGKTVTTNTTAGITLGAASNFITSSASPSDGPYIQIGNVASSVATGYRFISWRVGSSATECGSISTNGTSTTSYTTSSDYRLKEDVQPMTGALARVSALKPVTYKWKADGSDGEGFIAHELQEVCPSAVTGEKDAVNEDGTIKPQGIDTSFLVATLTAAIQEQQALITSLTARIAALEGAV
jgi:hypothetical protein